MKKFLLRAVLILILLVVVAGVVGYLFLDSIAKAGVEKGGTYALGVETQVETLNLSPFSGQLMMNGLNVANPAGFQSPHVMHSGKFDLELVPSSLLGDTVHIKKFELDGLDVNVEQKGAENNISKIMENLKRLGGDGKAEPDQQEEGTKVKIDKVLVRNVTATFHLPLVQSLEVKVPKLELEGIHSDDGGGVVLPKVIAQLVPAILAGVLKQGKDVIPGDLLNGLNGDISGVAQALGGEAEKLIGGVQGELSKALAGEGAGALGKEAGKVAGDLKKGVDDAVGGLLGGTKPDANQPKKKEGSGGLLDGIIPK